MNECNLYLNTLDIVPLKCPKKRVLIPNSRKYIFKLLGKIALFLIFFLQKNVIISNIIFIFALRHNLLILFNNAKTG